MDAWWKTQWFSGFFEGIDIPGLLTNFALNPMMFVNIGLQAMRIHQAWENSKKKLQLQMYKEERAFQYYNAILLNRFACGGLKPPQSWDEMERHGFKKEITDEFGTKYTIKEVAQVLYLCKYIDSLINY